jgi:HPt (histidine-containing phosphotransfer) domain-containing protein
MLILNSDATLKRLMNDTAFVGELYSTFLETLDARVQRICTAMESADFEEVRKEAHSLKGASGTINADALHACTLDLETAARSEDPVALVALKGRFTAVVTDTTDSINAWLAMHS